MKNLILVTLFSLCLLITGCRMLDQTILARETTPDGKELFIDHKTGERTTEPVGADGIANEPAYLSTPSSSFSGLTQLFGLAGPWGAVAGYGAGIAATIYGFFRRKGAIDAAKARAAAIKAGMPIVLSIVADWKSGVLDADKDGVVSIAEIADYIKKRALSSLTPDGIQSILKIISDAVMPEPVKTAELEKIAADL